MIVVVIAIIVVISLMDYIVVIASGELERMEEIQRDERSRATDAGSTEAMEPGEERVRN